MSSQRILWDLYKLLVFCIIMKGFSVLEGLFEYPLFFARLPFSKPVKSLNAVILFS